jgi:antitoxin (DNA-binding transcriptional repressor) of toxin-antitoxin stability system
MSVSQARDSFSEIVNRAAFAGRTTTITRGRNAKPVAALVPIALLQDYEALLDREDGTIVTARLAQISDGVGELIASAEVRRGLGL